MEQVTSTPPIRRAPPYRRRRIVVGLVALALVVGVTMLVRSLIGDDATSTSPDSTADVVTTSASSETTSDEATTSVALAETTTAPSAQPITVSLDPVPPVVEPTMVTEVQPTGGVAEFGVLRDGWVLLDGAASTATVFDRTGVVLRSFALAVVPAPFVIGPDDVLYGMTPPVDGRRSMVAVPLDGLAAGMVAAQTPLLDPGTYLDAPAGSLGLDVTGVVDRIRNVGTVLMPYLALDGDPITFADATFVTIDATGLVGAATGATWQLAIERVEGASSAPDVTASLLPSPTGAIYATTLADGSPGGGRAVIVELFADGTGRSSSLPEGWRVAAGSPFGTLLRRDLVVDSITTVEVAWFP